MIIGTGIDIVEIGRVKKALAAGQFRERVFTAEEIAYCEGRGKNKYACYAARFAAKEALVKALGSGFVSGQFTDIGVKNDELGAPRLILTGFYQNLAASRKVREAHISLSHSAGWAVAEVILEA